MELVTGATSSLLPKLGALLQDEYSLQDKVKKDRPLPLSPSTVDKAICAPSRTDHLAAVDPLDPSPPAAAPAAGGWGIVGSRCVHSVGRCRLAAGGAVEAVARSESLLKTAVLSSVLDAPVELRGGSAVPGAVVARWSCAAVFPLAGVRVMAEPAVLDLGGAVVVDQAGVVRGAGWRCSGAEERRLPGRSGAPPSPSLRWRSDGGFRRRSVLLDGEDAGAQKDLSVLVEMTNGGVDRSVECSGNINAMIQAFECVYDGWGVAVLVGVPHKNAEFKTHPMNFLNERTLKGTFFGNFKPRTDLPNVVEMYMKKELEVEKFITHSVPFSEINKAFDLMAKGEGIRCIIRMEN